MMTTSPAAQLLHSSVQTNHFDEWNSIVEESLIPLVARPSGWEGGFHGSLTALRAGDVGIVRGESVPQLVSRTSRQCQSNPTGLFGVFIQRSGRHEIQGAESRESHEGHTVTFFDVDSPYTIVERDAFTADAVVIPQHRLGHAPQLLARARRGPVSIVSAPGAIFASTIDQLMTKLDDCATDTALRLVDVSVDMFRIVIGDLAVPEAPAEVMYRAATEWIQLHLAEPDLGPERIASAVGLSLRHLHRIFAQAGNTVSAEIRTQRLALVQTYLRDPLRRSQTLAAIGLRAGLPDPAGLSRMFRRELGMTPTEYRASALCSDELLQQPIR